MRVAVVGAGPIGRATAAYLAHNGREVGIWSPTGRSVSDITVDPAAGDRLLLDYEGALAGQASLTRINAATEISDYELVVIAIPGHAYPAILPRIAEVVSSRQLVIVSGALSLAPLWLRERVVAQGHVPPVIVAWGTTLGTARRSPNAHVKLNTIRARFDMAAVPVSAAGSAAAACRELFGDRFDVADNALGVALANINPIAHAAETLPNLTRIDRREDWPLFHYLTESGARMCAALDAERIRVAEAFGTRVRPIEEHYRLSYHVEGEDIARIAEAIHAKYQGPLGPKTLDHRYVIEDVPFGLVFLEALAQCAGVDIPNVSASITLLSSACGRDFRRDNPLLRDLRIAESTPAELIARCRAA